MTDYRRIADDLDKALSKVLASIYETNSEEVAIGCDPNGFTQGLMEIARTSAWAKGLDAAHEERALRRAQAGVTEGRDPKGLGEERSDE